MSEIVKRLAPTKTTLRALYLKSGNQCAFPECRSLMIDDEGNFIGQVCHIEAAEKGGERFNPNQTNEQRRQPENLMLMCYQHHIKTNNVEQFSVERMREIKRQHESKFGDIAKAILKSVSDHTESTECSYPTTLRRINEKLQWRLQKNELDETLTELTEFANRVRRLPIPTRELLVIIIRRAERQGGLSTEFGVSADEIELVCDLDRKDLASHIGILDNHGFITEGDPYDYGQGGGIVLCDLTSGWPIAEDLKKYSELTGVTLTELLVELQFSLLD